ncbi:hypothetical protein [Peribacillus muralis]|uniref:hypothetical protein n=1 Tax=Peribacillus muralis TaxID=264697 RepID=UPI003CFC7094
MKLAYKYDKDFLYVPGGDIQLNDNDPIPKWYTDIPPVTTGGQGMFKPKFINGRWEEASENTIPVPPVPPKTEMEILQEDNLALKMAIAEMAEKMESEKIEMMLAVAELAELIKGGA